MKPSQTGPGTYVTNTTAAVTNYSPSTYIPTTTAAVSSLSGSNDGLLVEEARTNICFPSEDFDTSGSAWSGGGGAAPTVNLNQTIAPDGSLTADQIIDSAGTGTNSTGVVRTVNVSTSTAYTFSAFVKADQLSLCALRASQFTTPVNSEAWFDLSAGSVGTVDAGFDNSGIEDYGNGWYRCWVSFTTDATDTQGDVAIFVAQTDGSLTVDQDGTSSIFVWGAQLEAGACPTSYIPTTTGTVTRNFDDIITTDTSWLSSESVVTGTFYSHVIRPEETDYGHWSLNTGGSTRLSVRVGAAAQSFQSGKDNVLITVASGANIGDDIQIALAVAENDCKIYGNGVEGQADTSYNYAVKTQLEIGVNYGPANGVMNGLIKEIAYFDERLDNATLASYSTSGLPTAFPGTVAGDGGHIWPARANDPRWTQIITDSGITPSGNFIDDVHAALETMTSDTGAMDDLWKKLKAVYSITDTSEPYLY